MAHPSDAASSTRPVNLPNRNDKDCQSRAGASGVKEGSEDGISVNTGTHVSDSLDGNRRPTNHVERAFKLEKGGAQKLFGKVYFILVFFSFFKFFSALT